MTWLEWPPEAYMIECLLTREWQYLKGLEGYGGVALLEEVDFKVSKAHAKPRVSLGLRIRMQLLATTPVPCVLPCSPP